MNNADSAGQKTMKILHEQGEQLDRLNFQFYDMIFSVILRQFNMSSPHHMDNEITG